MHEGMSMLVMKELIPVSPIVSSSSSKREVVGAFRRMSEDQGHMGVSKELGSKMVTGTSGWSQ